MIIHLRGDNDNSACYVPAISCHFSNIKTDINCKKCKQTRKYKDKK